MVSLSLSGAVEYSPLMECVGNIFGFTSERALRLWESAHGAQGPLGAARLYSRVYLPLAVCIDRIRGSVRNRDEWREVRRIVRGLKTGILEDIIVKSEFTPEKKSLVREKLGMLEDALKNAGYMPLSLHFRFNSRAMVGKPPLPFMMLFEGGTIIDPVLEVPYIPGSSFKGLLRMIYERMGARLPKCLSGISEASLFGSKEGVGAIVLTDAYPDPAARAGYLLDGDVTTPIYAGGTATPRVEEHRARPVPAQYPVVRSGVAFVEIMGVRRERFEGACRDDLQALFRSFFALAAGVGIGRKVSLGYGEMIVIG